MVSRRPSTFLAKFIWIVTVNTSVSTDSERMFQSIVCCYSLYEPIKCDWFLCELVKLIITHEYTASEAFQNGCSLDRWRKVIGNIISLIRLWGKFKCWPTLFNPRQRDSVNSHCHSRYLVVINLQWCVDNTIIRVCYNMHFGYFVYTRTNKFIITPNKLAVTFFELINLHFFSTVQSLVS